MRLRISHRTTYAYEPPARSVIQILRVTPRSHESQRVVDWRVDLDAECKLAAEEDAFGNVTHTFSIAGPIPVVTILAEGEIETLDAAGVVRGAVERFPPGIFLRDTDLTRADAALHDFADAISGAGTLDRLHALMSAVHGRLIFDPAPTHSGTSAREAFALGRGVCQDFAHVFVACARRLGIPARYVSGYFLRTDGVRLQDAGHAWAEAFVEDLGWVGFDCAHGVCPHEQHVRVACGLDYLGAAPVRGSRQGGGRESLAVSVDVSLAQWPQSA